MSLHAVADPEAGTARRVASRGGAPTQTTWPRRCASSAGTRVGGLRARVIGDTGKLKWLRLTTCAAGGASPKRWHPAAPASRRTSRRAGPCPTSSSARLSRLPSGPLPSPAPTRRGRGGRAAEPDIRWEHGSWRTASTRRARPGRAPAGSPTPGRSRSTSCTSAARLEHASRCSPMPSSAPGGRDPAAAAGRRRGSAEGQLRQALARRHVPGPDRGRAARADVRERRLLVSPPPTTRSGCPCGAQASGLAVLAVEAAGRPN